MLPTQRQQRPLQTAGISWIPFPLPNSSYFHSVDQARARVLQQVDLAAAERLVEKELVSEGRKDQEEKAAGEFLDGNVSLQDVFQEVRAGSAQLKVKGLQKAVSAFLLYT